LFLLLEVDWHRIPHRPSTHDNSTGWTCKPASTRLGAKGLQSEPQSSTADRPPSVKVRTAKEKGLRFQKPFENPSPFACDLDHHDAPFNDVQMLVREP
jgi:hypothetical protein